MCDINPVPEDKKICRGCLSWGRKLTQVATGDLCSLLTEDQKLEALTILDTALCWECIALMHRTQRFRAQVQKAHSILQGSLHLLPEKPTLSSLTIHCKCVYDAVLEESKPSEQQLLHEVQNTTLIHEKVIIPTKYKTIITNNKESLNDVNTEHSSDESDDNQNVEADNMNLSSFEEMAEASDEDFKKVDSPINTNKTPDKKVTYPRFFLNQRVERNKTQEVSFIKTPEMLKLEIELKKLIDAKKIETKTEILDSENKFDKKKIANGKKKHCKGTDDVEKLKKKGEYDTGNVAEKQCRFRKLIIRFKNIADVVPYFKEIEMSEHDLKSTLEKDDAIVDEKKPVKCNVCGIMYKTKRLLDKHAFSYHKGKYPNQFKKGNFKNPPLVQPEKSVWQCSVCARTMRSEHIVTHMNEYHRTRYWCAADGCQWCPKHFWEKGDFDQHWEAVHKQFTCDICEIIKNSKKRLERHMVKAHAPPKQPASFQCPHCPKKFSYRNCLKRHELSHVRNEPSELRYCVECDITFKKIKGFKQHFSLRHSGKAKKWPCKQCGKVLATRQSYKNHVNIIHKGKTDHCCHICGKYLSSPQSLKNHLNAHNNIRPPKNKPCAICGRMFQSNKNRRLHMHTHTGERPYKCPHCETAFTQPYCLRMHLAKRHGVEAVVMIDGTIVLQASMDKN